MNSLFKQLLRYGFVGGAAFALDFSTLTFCREVLHWGTIYAATTGFVLGLILNYVLCLYFVFSKNNADKHPLEFIIFASVGVAGLFVNDLVIYGLAEAGVDYKTGKLVATAAVFFFNFFGRRYLLFSENSNVLNRLSSFFRKSDLPET